MVKRVGIIISIISFFLIVGVANSAPSISDFILYNYQTGLGYFNNSVSQWLIGGTATTTNAKLEVGGDIYVTSTADICISGGNCLSSVVGSGGNPFNQWLDTTNTPEFAGLTINGNATTTGNFAAYGGNSDQWNTAFSWGNHADAGYLTSALAATTYLALTDWFSTTTHPNISSLPSLSITESQISDLDHYTDTDTGNYITNSTTIREYFNWAETAYGWGDHSLAGYLLQSEWETTTTDALSEGSSNFYYTDDRVATYLNTSTTLAIHQDYVWDFSDNTNATEGDGINFTDDEISLDNTGNWAGTWQTYAPADFSFLGVEHWLTNSDGQLTPTGSIAVLTPDLYFTNATGTNTLTTNITSTNAYTSSFGINSEYFTDLTGTGLNNTAGVLGINLASDFNWTGTHTFNWISATTSFDYWFNESSTIQTLLGYAQTAYDWGDHAVAGYLLQSEWEETTTDALAEGLSNFYYTEDRFDASYNATTTLNGFTDNSTNWNTAYSWGDHSLAGYLTNINDQQLGQLTDVNTTTLDIGNILYWDGTEWITGITSTWNIYSASGTLLDLTDNVFSVNEGTLTNGKYCTYVEGTGIECNSEGGSASLENLFNQWLDTTSTVEFANMTISGNATTTGNFAAFGGNSDQWNTAFSWGDHALAGYLFDNPFNQQLDTTNTVEFVGMTLSGITGSTQCLNVDTNGVISGTGSECGAGGGGYLLDQWLDTTSTVQFLSITTTNAYFSSLGVNSEYFTDLTGTGLSNVAGALGVDLTAGFTWTGTHSFADMLSTSTTMAKATITDGLILEADYYSTGNATTTGSMEITTPDALHGFRFEPGATTSTIKAF